MSKQNAVTQRLLDGEARIHQLLAGRAPLTETLSALADLVEDLSPEASCSILLLDDSGQLRTGAAPSLPDAYNEKVDGLVPAPDAGSCGTAAHIGRTVIASDIRSDPLWEKYRDVAAEYGLGACWSTPIRSVPDDDILGTFAIYYREPRSPTRAELELVRRFGGLAAIIIESSRSREEAFSRTQELEHLLRITRAINAGRTVEEVLDGIFESFRGTIPYDRAEYAILEEEGTVLRTRWVRATYEDLKLPVDFVHRRSRPLESVRDQRWEATIDNDLVSYAASKPEGNPTHLLVAEGIRSALNCPLVLREEVVGYLFFVSRAADAYRPEHAALIEQVAAHIAGAIEQHRLGEALREQNRRLEELQQTRSTFLATVSHELRTPLTAVVGLTAEMRDHVGSLSTDEVAEFAAMVHQEATDVAGIVEDLLVVARTEAEDVVLDLQPMELKEEARSVLTARSGEVSLDVELVGTAPTAIADPLRVRQIIRNLLSNSRRHGGPNVTVRLSNGGTFATLVVADDGEPIPDELRVKMFDPYAHGENDRIRPGSVGLGLWVARHLARAMGGDLTYDYKSTESRFELTLPVAETS